MSHHESHVATYVSVYIALLVLVIATVGVATIPLGALAFPIAISIAFTKAFLIIWIFMHVKNESSLVKVFAFLGIGWMSILFVFLFCDYFTRAQTMADYPGAWSHRGRLSAPAEGGHGHHADHPKSNAEGHAH